MMEEEMGTLVGDAKVVQSTMEKARAEVERLSFEQLLQAPWPAFHGTALYVSAARLNHSCMANMKLTFPGNSAALSVVALAPVAVGEELCISYISQDDNAQNR